MASYFNAKGRHHSHQDRCCGPCFICGKQQLRYDHFCILEDSVKKILQHYYGEKIPEDGCLCRSHQKEAKRHRSDPDYIPKWKKEKKHLQEMKCTYPECNTTSKNGKIIFPCDEKRTTFSSIINMKPDALGALCDKG